MSRIGKRPIDIAEGVNITLEGNTVRALGPKGEISTDLEKGVSVVLEEGRIVVASDGKGKNANAVYGLSRALIANLVEGVSKGFEKKLEMVGVGFRAQAQGSELTLSVGFSHQVKIKAPESITFTVAESKGGNVVVTVTGIDKQLVGQIAAQIRRVKPPEPYKGKGIRYLGERIRKKAGKAAKAVGTK